VKRTQTTPSPLTKFTLALISLAVGSVGLLVIYTGYAPERATRFGLVGPLLGPDAIAFGSMCFMSAAVPLLCFLGASDRPGPLVQALASYRL
jgi:hypothetical protein